MKKGFFVCLALCVSQLHSEAYAVSAALHGNVVLYPPITISETQPIHFGSIIRPTTGSNRITIDAVTGNKQILGSGNGGTIPISDPFRVGILAVNAYDGALLSFSITPNATPTGLSWVCADFMIRSETSGALPVCTSSASLTHNSVGGTGIVSGNYYIGGGVTVSSNVVAGFYAITYTISINYQ